MSRLTRALCAASTVALVVSETAFAQSQLPPIVVQTAPKTTKRMSATPRAPHPAAAKRATLQVASRPPVPSAPSAGGGSLTVPTTAEATAAIERTPGAVAVVPDSRFKDGPANTIKDVLDWVPGVVTQPKSNIDNRVSIRGSGLTRNYGNRGINVYMDGIPINTADGLFDLFEIDPTAYRYA